uniref:DEPP1 autophagy regulator n=1 Tax=Astyanax mexicanus TaxID=7994 RepID=A0A3B1KCQ0_ASTMX
MKPRRLLLSIAPLPTITETHEDASQVACPATPLQSLEEYVNSIKELAQPACGPVRMARTLRTRLSSRTPRARSNSLGLDERTRHFSSQKDWASRDPVDWLFGQTQDELHRTDCASAALSQTIYWEFLEEKGTEDWGQKTQQQNQTFTQILTCKLSHFVGCIDDLTLDLIINAVF